MSTAIGYGQDASGQWWSYTPNTDGTISFQAAAGPGPSQPVVLAAPTVRELITDALMEINVLAQGEDLPNEDAQFAFRKLQRMLDLWNARKINIFNVTFTLFSLLPNHQPHTIGPSLADLVGQRPVTINAASIVLPGTPSTIRIPLNIRDDDWWAANRVREIASSISTDLYYSPDYPNGSLYLWPIPNMAYGLELETWSSLAQVATLDDPVNVPPAYQEAIVLSLAESCCAPFGAPLSAALVLKAKEARTAFQSNNAKAPRMATQGAGMPSGGGAGRFNFLTGQPW